MIGLHVTAISLTRKSVLLNDGRTMPITDTLDDDGLPTDDLGDTIAVVAGEGAVWFMELVDDFEHGRLT